ncbi:alpha/beta hydrolase [Herbiconiux sp. KACC 21604]|uniref:alpha/beta hydrolase fold domain-containing protein n=1 Tax=unclassified Herbiconiux TaxID=2618217 RepID=UPI001491AF21|nr:alpha/beta hydrolase [Herbiconiux sp. SALV-R1]QJU54926.1 alpha/beta hydrolase fold domain-containing protein [Herbiconiux sp. SALV-R1]WPO86051.1 alpha/beta hydrolase [Herbiconiux sp. KACC 21604]
MSVVMRAVGPVLRVRRAVGARPRRVEELEATLRGRVYPRAAGVPRGLRERCEVREEVVGGHPVITLTPREGASGVRVVHLHGGAYVHPLVVQHWSFLGALIAASGATVTVPLYGLAPEFTVDDALPFLAEVRRRVFADADGGPVFFSGDSAGGALAVQQALHARRDVTAPANASAATAAGVVLVSPWLDAALADPRVAAIVPRDAMLEPERLRISGRLWAGDRDVRDAEVSPLFADRQALAGLPPVRIVQGGRDVMLPDATTFARTLRRAGVDVDLRIYPDGFHNFPAVPALPESRDAIAWIADFLHA